MHSGGGQGLGGALETGSTERRETALDGCNEGGRGGVGPHDRDAMLRRPPDTGVTSVSVVEKLSSEGRASGTTPLYIAAMAGHVEVVERLIAAKSDIDLKIKVRGWLRGLGRVGVGYEG
eukprot:3212123-Rhodomonas_salina.3